MKIKFDEYKISLLTKLFGVSPDTIRLYEKKGLLKPEKRINNYRVFSRYDFFDMEYISILKRMGFSLTDIYHILTKASEEELIFNLNKRLYEIQKKELSLQEEKREAESLLKIISELEDKTEKLEIIKGAEIICCEISTVDETRNILTSLGIDDNPRLTAVIQNILTDRIEDDDTKQEMELVYTTVNLGNSVTEKQYDSNISGITIIPRNDYIRSVTKTATGSSNQNIGVLQQFMKDNRIDITGLAYSRCIMGQKIRDESDNYYETWIQIKP